MTNDFFKTEGFNLHDKRIGKTPIARLIKLSSDIEKWSQDRLSKNAEGVIEEFSIEDIQALRKSIKNEVSAIRSDEPNVVSDQILFLIIGAIKVQAQNNSETTWPLVNQTIKELVAPPKRDSNMMYFSLISFIIVIGFVLTIFSINSKNRQSMGLSSVQVTQETPINEVGSKIVGNLIAVYNQMQQGDCQLPQALVLQPKDREAFIAFVTEGKVNINTAEDLKKSLDYVNCNYSQKLMINPLNIF